MGAVPRPWANTHTSYLNTLRGLEAAAVSLPPAELGIAAAALAAGRRGFQQHLAPTLPARLGAVLEDRIREFAMLPGVLTRLLLALGGMGHTLRTEVLQASGSSVCGACV